MGVKMEDTNKRIERLEESIIRLIPKPSLNFSYHLIDGCNLNCRGCWHFAPLAGRNMPRVEEFESDVKRLAEVMGGEISLISLFGGEPLLNPEAYKYPYIIRKYLSDTKIELLTNGTLIPDQSTEFWESMRVNAVVIEWTRYPIGEEKNKRIEDVLKNENAEYRVFNAFEEEKSLSQIVIDVNAIGNNGQKGRNDARWQWIHCFRAGDCIQLKNHKLYPCTTAANAHLLKEYFGLDIRLSQFDGIDIYEAVSKKEILDFLSKPIPFCRYCRVERESFGHNWEPSNKELREWT